MRFKTIMADPPWPYETPGKGPLAAGTPSNPEAWRGELTGSGLAHRYPPMPMDEICALRVADVAEDSAHLYLWVTNAFLVDGSGGRVALAWGFRPITVITWAKVKKGRPEDDPEPSMKTGYYYRGATEHCIFAVRGAAVRLAATESTAFLHPRPSRHSEKPATFYDRVERCSPGPYAELFARENRPGWSAWGNDERLVVAPELSALGGNA